MNDDNDLSNQFAKQVAEGKKNGASKKEVSKLGDRLRTVVKQASKLDKKRVGQLVVSGMNLAVSVGKALPNKNSTPFGVVCQSIGALDVVRQTIWASTGDPVSRYATQNALQKVINETFVKIFFGTDLHTKFSSYEVRVSDYRTLLDCQGPLGRFAFTKSDYQDKYDSTYYVRPDTKMTEVLEGLWKQYDGRLHATITPNIYGQGVAEFSGFTNNPSPLFGSTTTQMESLLARHRRCVKAKVPRSYMLHGVPGTGKTSFAMAFACALNARVLKLGAGSLAHISVKDIGTLLTHLAPEFLIIDDVDKIQAGNALPTLLDIIQRFKDGDGQTTLMMTSNVIDGFDSGILRPGRVDTWLEFHLPDADERKLVMTAYAKALGVEVPDAYMDAFVIESDKLSHDYLREIITELKQCGSFDEVIKLVRLNRKLLLKVEETAKTNKENAKKEED